MPTTPARPASPPVLVRPVSDAGAWPAVWLEHGEAPAAAAVRAVAQAGGPTVEVTRPRTISRGVHEGLDALLIELDVRVSDRHDASPPDASTQAQAATGEAVRFRRLGAYAVVVAQQRILLTELSQDTPAPGTWTLPGGGIDAGESPLDAVVREVFEETAHQLADPQLLDVDSTHFTGRSPSGRLEDFHGIGVLYAAGVCEVLEPQVLEVDGSTAAARWVPLDELPTLRMTPRSRARVSRSLSLGR